ncbi:MAG: hypothetical protein M3Y87_09570 [Myxococcota bacterium]|nr:hypothetical protein [Myxococcota bacterium]
MRLPRAASITRALLIAATLLGSARLARAQTAEPETPGFFPTGTVHFALQVAGTIAFLDAGANDAPRWYPGGELAVGADVRVLPVLHLRGMLVVGAQAYDASTLSTGVRVVAREGTGVGFGGVRVLAGLVLPPLVALRIGIELGIEAIAHVGGTTSYAGGLFEIALRLLDDERLEIGVQLAAQSRSRFVEASSEPEMPVTIARDASGRASLFVGYLF